MNYTDQYRTLEEAILDRDLLDKLRMALKAAKSSLRQDECQTWQLKGKGGQIITNGNRREEWLVYVEYGCRPRKWNSVKKRAPKTLRLRNDGDEGGSFMLTSLPSESDAAFIREIIRLPSTRPHRLGSEAALAKWRVKGKNCLNNSAEVSE